LPGVLEGLRRWIGTGSRPSESDLEGTIAWEVDRRLGAPDYQSLPAVGRARELITSIVGQLDLLSYRDGLPMDQSPAIISRPAPGITRDVFLGQIAGELFDHSNAFLWLPETGRNAAGFPDVAIVLPFGEVSVTWDDSRLFRRYRWRERELVAGRTIVHIELPGRRPEELVTPSKFDLYADAFARIIAAEQYAGDWYENGGVPSITLKYASVITDVQAEAAADRFAERHRGPRPAVMGAGWDIHESSANPETAQLLATRRAGTLEVARIYGIVPGDLLLAPADSSSLTYQNIAGMLDTFMRVTGQPVYLSPIESALTDLVPRTQAIRFETSELFRLQEADRIHVGAEAIASQIYTLPEVRRSLGLPPGSAPRVPAELEPMPPAPAEVAVNAA
jgi:hypothetical protein